MDKPLVIIPYGLGFNSHIELGYMFELAGAEVKYVLLNDLISNPDILDGDCRALGLPGGFTMGDQLTAGQSVANRTKSSGLYPKLTKKVADPKFPIFSVCNSVQISSKLDLFPVKVGTMQNDSGKHETGLWDVKINPDNDSIWLELVKECKEPLFAPISHGQGKIYLPEDDLKIAKETNLIALTYHLGYICDYYKSSRGGRYNPNGSTADIAGLAWNGNIELFPHFERLHHNYQRPDRKAGDLSLYEPSFLIFKSGVDYMKSS